jgi:hypothetical protein
MTEGQIYAEAGRIIQIAMGKEKVKRRRVTVWRANEDPLGYWSGVQSIVALVQRAAMPTEHTEG